jgi:hypothetical protein
MIIAASMTMRSSSVESFSPIEALCLMDDRGEGDEAWRNRRCSGRGDAVESIMMRRSSSAYVNHRTSVADDCRVVVADPELIMTMIDEAEEGTETRRAQSPVSINIYISSCKSYA